MIFKFLFLSFIFNFIFNLTFLINHRSLALIVKSRSSRICRCAGIGQFRKSKPLKPNQHPRILNGEIVGDEDLLFVGTIYRRRLLGEIIKRFPITNFSYYYLLFCAVNLINEEWALSAAHW